MGAPAERTASVDVDVPKRTPHHLRWNLRRSVEEFDAFFDLFPALETVAFRPYACCGDEYIALPKAKSLSSVSFYSDRGVTGFRPLLAEQTSLVRIQFRVPFDAGLSEVLQQLPQTLFRLDLIHYGGDAGPVGRSLSTSLEDSSFLPNLRIFYCATSDRNAMAATVAACLHRGILILGPNSD
jgi:hypothetical protein